MSAGFGWSARSGRSVARFEPFVVPKAGSAAGGVFEQIGEWARVPGDPRSNRRGTLEADLGRDGRIDLGFAATRARRTSYMNRCPLFAIDRQHGQKLIY
jgi:hypothetical protein